MFEITLTFDNGGYGTVWIPKDALTPELIEELREEAPSVLSLGSGKLVPSAIRLSDFIV